MTHKYAPRGAFDRAPRQRKAIAYMQLSHLKATMAKELAIKQALESKPINHVQIAVHRAIIEARIQGGLL